MLLEEHIKAVNQKLQQLLKQYRLLQKDKEILTASLNELKILNEGQLEKIEQLKMQVGILKSTTGQMNEADKKSFDKQLSQYIKEIDKCIGVISE